MDREPEEIQFLGFFGILKESFNIVSSSWRKIFIQITLAFIVPLSFIYLSQIQISQLLFSKIIVNELMLDRLPEGTKSYNKISDLLSSEWTVFFLFKIGYIIFFIILALLSTSAVVYTIACIYTAKEVNLKNVLSVVPKVWKRLMVTFVWSFIIVFAYNVISLLVLILGAVLFGLIPIAVSVFLALFAVAYLVGLFYITIIWNLATVVSVLEERYGHNAMVKSWGLINGKIGISVAIFAVIGLCFFGTEILFEFMVVVPNEGQGVGSRAVYGIVCLVLLSIAMLFGLITQAIVYFVCKSYHHENIDKSSLAYHLGGYLGEYVPLKSKVVQLEQLEV